MSTCIRLDLPDSLTQFVEQQAAEGGFPSPGDFVQIRS